MTTKLKYLLFTMTFLMYSTGHAQNFEWLKTYGTQTKSSQSFVDAISSKDDGSCTILVNLLSNNNTQDIIFFDSIQYKKPPTIPLNQVFLVEKDSNGSVIRTARIGSFVASDMCTDENGNYFIIGRLNAIDSVGNIVLDSANGSLLIAKFDSAFNLVWAKQYGNSASGGNNIIYSGNRLLFLANCNGKSQIADSLYLFNNNTPIYGEINKNNGWIKWSNYIYANKPSFQFFLNDMAYLNHTIFISGYLNNHTAITKNDTFIGPAGFIISIDTLGKYKNKFLIKANHETRVFSLATDDKYLYFTGFSTDSLKWGNKLIQSNYTTGNYSFPNNQKREAFVASITPAFETRWFYRPKLVEPNNPRDLTLLFKINQCAGYFYVGGYFGAKLQFDNTTLNPTGTLGVDFLIVKFDFLGNCLWATQGGTSNKGQVLSINTIANRSVFVGGSFSGNINMGGFNSSSKSNDDAWITKITDYSVSRGQVKSGPYCAGDTIWVPYTHIGTFDTSNVFIAELSDEFGNFDGGHRELGRLKTNQDSTIAGLLPLFQVSSSLQYRIRVRSTAPAIQSYFLLDTLRLLIYSRDKADPGPALSICYRDTVQLSTFGGTRWTWSPQYLMDDSTLRQPLVWPERDTVFKIIISDSSGCGAPDTAYKTVYVKQRPVLVGDTLYNKCDGKDIRLRLFTRNTDSSGHSIVWYKNNNRYFANDSMLYIVDESVVFKAVLTDFCSPAKDSMQIKVNYLGPLKLLPIKDTVVCANASVLLSAKGTGGQTADYQFSWYNKQRTFMGSGFPTVNITESDTFKVILRDGCSAFSDSALWVVALADKINTQKDMGLPKDTVFCSAFSLGLKIKNTHADDAITWVDLNKQTQIGTTESLTVFKPSSIEATVKNSCGITKDTIVIKQLAAPQIKLDSLYDACENINLILTIGNKQNEEKLLWSTAETTATITITKAGNYWAKVANFCGKDSVGFKVVLYPQPNCDFIANDVCEGEKFVFNNLTKGGKTYQWRFGDGNNSSDSAPAHQYAVTRTSRTYFVTLVASISANCSDSISQPLNVNATADAGFSFSSQGNKIFFTPKTTDANNTYQWHFGDGDSSKQINPTHQYKADSGAYNVCLAITNAANCKSQVCEPIRYSVGILDINALGFSIYPNPTNGIINLQFEQNQGPILVELYNSLGEKVLTKKQSQGTNCELDLSGMSEGVYWVRVVTDLGVGYKKVVRIE